MANPVITVRRRRPKANGATGGVLAEAYYSKTIGRAFDVLDCFLDGQTRLGLMEISQRMHLPEASLFRVLLTLESRGYLCQNQDGSYRLTPRTLYGKARERADQLRELVRPHLRALADRFNETASLAHLSDDRIHVLDSIDALHEVRMINRPGRVLPPHCSSMGKAIASFQTPELIDRILEVYGLYRRTPNTIIDRQTLMKEFERIRERGHATDREEAAQGGICIGAPIRIEGRQVDSAISVSTPTSRMTPDREQDIIRGVNEAAMEIARVVESNT